MSLTNPLTGRKIREGGPTHRKLLRALITIEDIQKPKTRQRGGGKKKEAPGKVVQSQKDDHDDFYKKLLKKTQKLDTPVPVRGTGSKDDDSVTIPKSKYHLISSAMPPNPEQHSWYHHHAPFSQNFGDYVCLKKSTLQDLGVFLRDSLLSDIK